MSIIVSDTAILQGYAYTVLADANAYLQGRNKAVSYKTREQTNNHNI